MGRYCSSPRCFEPADVSGRALEVFLDRGEGGLCWLVVLQSRERELGELLHERRSGGFAVLGPKDRRIGVASAAIAEEREVHARRDLSVEVEDFPEPFEFALS